MGKQNTTAERNGQLWSAGAEDWAAIQEKTCLPVYEAALARLALGPESRCLDVGCGAGLAAERAHARGARVAGLDAAPKLLAIAQRRTPEGDFRLGELESLPFPDGTFDVVTGFNSIQYAAEPGRALAEARRVTKPGGRVLAMTWGTPDGMEAASLLAALKPLLPPLPPGAPGPFALSDEAALRAFAAGAGLTSLEVFDVESPWEYASREEALRGLGSSGVAARAAEQAGREAVDHAHAAALAPFRQQDGRYRIGAWYRCVVGRA